MNKQRSSDVALLCNPRAGGRWRVLGDVLDCEEAKDAHRIVTDDIEDVREAISGLGQRVKLLCIYGGDGTIHRVINELLRKQAGTPPRLAFLGGGTMNVTAGWCGMRRSAGDNFRDVMRAYRADRMLWREVPLLAVSHDGKTRHGFSFGLGPLVRLLERFESGSKSRLGAVQLGVQAILASLSGVPGTYQPLLRELEAHITVDGVRLPQERFAAMFANVTGVINPFVEPFTTERTQQSFYFLAYAVSTREFAVMTPLLARGLLPIDARALLRPISSARRALLSFVGGEGLPVDPRYINHPAQELVIETAEPCYTIDGEVFPTNGKPIEVRLGPQLRLATLPRKGLANLVPSRLRRAT